jgi:phosphoribosylanthranilate isomerase
MVRVKICGITNWTDARLAVDAGADVLGFNFWDKSPRRIAPEYARVIAKRLPRRIYVAGVFVNAPIDKIWTIAREADLNLIQLHGDESPADVAAIGERYTVMKAFRVSPSFNPKKLALYEAAHAFLLDGYDPDKRGGTGKVFDWRLARAARKYGVIAVAGGIRPDNVRRAIAQARPDFVDVCSGVEASPGVKDRKLLYALMQEVERARGAAE